MRDTAPHPKAPTDSGLSFHAKVVIGGFGLAAALTFGAIECKFAGCEALFIAPLVFDAAVLAFALLGPD